MKMPPARGTLSQPWRHREAVQIPYGMSNIGSACELANTTAYSQSLIVPSLHIQAFLSCVHKAGLWHCFLLCSILLNAVL